MKLYITSSPTGTYLHWGEKEFDGFNTQNGMVDNLRRDLQQPVRCLMIAASPDEFGGNDWMLGEFRQRIIDTGFAIERMEICDHRNHMEMSCRLKEFNFIILGGGHVPTQNAFFREMNLREKMRDFDGVVMGISAGSMNCADLVYAQPEEEGESVDPNYQRFMQGLGLTDLMILPHYNAVKNNWLDGKRLFEDITYGDSYGRQFWVLTDGSYILQRDGETYFCGEIYRIADGRIEPVNG